MSRQQDQDKWTASEPEQVVLNRMGMSEWMAGKLIREHGFEFRYVDPDIHPRHKQPLWDGLIFGSRRTHEKLFDWFAKELAKPIASSAMEPCKPHPEVESPADDSGGAEMYARRLAGESWAALGGKAASMRAKRYALSHDLIWPPALA